MNERLVFGGIAGQALRGALNRTALVSGMALVSALVLSGRGLALLDRLQLLPIVLIGLVTLVLAFHATREACGGNYSARRSLVVGLRCLALTLVWLVPWMLWGSTLGERNAMLTAVGSPSALAVGLYLFGCMMATPVILIAALRARGWRDLLSPAHWSRELNDRGTDLMTIYTIQTGAAALVTVTLVPFVLIALRFNNTAGFVGIGLATCVVAGYWTALTGRLCGSLHRTPPVQTAIEPNRPRFDEGLAIARSALDAELNRDRPAIEPDAVPQEPAMETDLQQHTDEPDPDRSEEDEKPRRETEKIQRYAAPARPIAFNTPRPSHTDRKTPLLDASDRVEEAMKRFRLDPSHTLSRLAELNQDFAPNAHVLQALAICLHRTGHTEQAFTAARQAFPLCFERGYISLSAAMFYELRGQLQRFDLRQEHVLEIAETLHRADELAAAAKAYSLVIHADPDEIRATKGLLDVAERILEHKRKPAAAAKVYTFLLDHCKASGMTGLIRDGLDRCRQAEEAAQPASTLQGP